MRGRESDGDDVAYSAIQPVPPKVTRQNVKTIADEWPGLKCVSPVFSGNERKNVLCDFATS